MELTTNSNALSMTGLSGGDRTYDQLQQQIYVIDGQILTIQGEINNINLDFNALETQVDTNTADIVLINDKLIVYDASFNIIEDQIVILQDTDANLQDSINNINTSILDLDQLVDDTIIEVNLIKDKTKYISSSSPPDETILNSNLIINPTHSISTPNIISTNGTITNLSSTNGILNNLNILTVGYSQTPITTDNSTKIATTAYVKTNLSSIETSLVAINSDIDAINFRTEFITAINALGSQITWIQSDTRIENQDGSPSDYKFRATNIQTQYIQSPQLSGCFMIDSSTSIYIPIYKSTPDFNNFYNTITTEPITIGTFFQLNCNDIANVFSVGCKYRLVAYQNTLYGGTILLDYTNNSLNPTQLVSPTIINAVGSCKIYYDGVEIV